MPRLDPGQRQPDVDRQVWACRRRWWEVQSWEPGRRIHLPPDLRPLAVFVFPSHHLGHRDSAPAGGCVSNQLGPEPGPGARQFPFLGLSVPICRALPGETGVKAGRRRWAPRGVPLAPGQKPGRLTSVPSLPRAHGSQDSPARCPPGPLREPVPTGAGRGGRVRLEAPPRPPADQTALMGKEGGHRGPTGRVSQVGPCALMSEVGAGKGEVVEARCRVWGAVGSRSG